MKKLAIPKKWMTLLGVVSFSIIILVFGVYTVTSIFNWYVKIALAIGVLGVLAFWILSAITSRSARYGSNVAVAILLAFVIIVLINYVSARRSVRFDVTAGRQFSLSEQTKKIIKNLDRDINITAFYTEDHYRRRYVRDLLGEYDYQSDRIQFTMVDPSAKPGLAMSYSIRQNGTVIFEAGEMRENIESHQNEEQDFTSAILKLTSDKKKKVYFLDGHGERDIDGYDDNGYSGIKKMIESDNYEVSKLILAGQASVPEDCSILVIAGPQKSLFPQETAAINSYLEKGGKAIIMIDPTPSPPLSDLLQKWGVHPRDDIILDGFAKAYLGDPTIPITVKYSHHLITAPLTRIMTFFPMARSLNPDVGARTDLEVVKLVETSEDSWGETNTNALLAERQAKFDQGIDTEGPLSTALAVTLRVEGEDETKDRRVLVAIGDSDFAANKYLQQGNPDLFMNSLNWLVEDEKLISIRPKDQDEAKVRSLTGQQLRMIAYTSIFAIPLALLIIGGIVWLKRR